jgi:murein DD-endopeptidase MepM/ murein hydrolase activator NlpD
MTERIWRPTELPIDPNTMKDVGVQTMRVTSPYGWRRSPFGGQMVFHDGLDIGNGIVGDWLVADADGIVEVAGAPGFPWSEPTTRFPSGNWGGTMVVIDHGMWVSVYAHMDPKVRVKKDARVKMGQRIGKVGETGSAAPPPLGGGGHVHYGHIMLPVSAIKTLGAARKPTRDPWPVIEPDDPMPVAKPTRLERMRATAMAWRKAKPRAYQRWLKRTELTEADDGRVLTQLMRLSAEISSLREAPEEN